MAGKLTFDVLVSPEARRRAMEDDVRRGLAETPRTIPPVWFYDEVGSRLFDRITRLPEYYLTRAERSILALRSNEIAAEADADTLVEIGSGTSEKTGLLLDAMAEGGRLRRIVLLDISEEVLREAAEELAGRYHVDVHAVVGDLRYDLTRLPAEGRRLWAFLGSTVGNFPPEGRGRFLAQVSGAMNAGDSFLLGADLQKDVPRLLVAYDDAEGVTARFNLNVLSVLNVELGADFDTDRFEHRAVWNEAGRWIEMRLRSTVSQHVHIKALDFGFDLAEGEELLTEISAKFDRAELAAEVAAAGMVTSAQWTDPDGDFLLTLTRR